MLTRVRVFPHMRRSHPCLEEQCLVQANAQCRHQDHPQVTRFKVRIMRFIIEIHPPHTSFHRRVSAWTLQVINLTEILVSKWPQMANVPYVI